MRYLHVTTAGRSGEHAAKPKGIGGRLLRRLLAEVRRFGGDVVVDPGGYGMNTARQRSFYRQNGFVNDPEIKGRLRYEGG